MHIDISISPTLPLFFFLSILSLSPSIYLPNSIYLSISLLNDADLKS
jgi:hypothetical protein